VGSNACPYWARRAPESQGVDAHVVPRHASPARANLRNSTIAGPAGPTACEKVIAIIWPSGLGAGYRPPHEPPERGSIATKLGPSPPLNTIQRVRSIRVRHAPFRVRPPSVELPMQLKLAPTHLSMTSPPRCRAVSTGTWIVTAQSLRRLRKQIFTDPHGHSACRLGPVTCPTMPNRRRGMCPPRAAHNDRAPETSEAGHDTGTHSDTGPRSKHGQTIRGRFPNQRARSRDCLQQRRR
jgi:hypothetical protein